MLAKKHHNVAFSWAGIMAAAVFLICWMAAIAFYPNWEFCVDVFSDFGVSGDASELIFNYGSCWLVGLLICIFGAGCIAYPDNRYMAFGGVFMILAGIFLFLVGVFPANTALHTPIAITFGLFFLISFIIYGAGSWVRGHVFAVGVSAIFALVISAFTFMCGVPGLEAGAGICGIGWLVLQGVELMTSKPMVFDEVKE